MKDFSRQVFEDPVLGSTAGVPAHAVEFCLEALYRDNEHEITDNVVAGLTFEELIGALRQVVVERAQREAMDAALEVDLGGGGGR